MLQYYVTDATLIADTMTDGLRRINLEELRVLHEILFGYSYLQNDKVRMSDNRDPLLTRLKSTLGTKWIAENKTYYETKIRDLETKVKSLEDQVTRDATKITEEQAIATELRRQLADATSSSRRLRAQPAHQPYSFQVCQVLDLPLLQKHYR
jgi:predicted RNase H-like nuclease (RuvC/YqgF family)